MVTGITKKGDKIIKMYNLINDNDIKKQRNYGLDFLRIISMLMIVFLHVLRQGGILELATPFSINYEVAWLLEVASFCAVNCYALLSGYVGIEAKFKYSNIIYLWLQVAFYTIIITIVFCLFMPGAVNRRSFVKAICPVLFKQYWYFTAYFAMFFFIPFFNHLVKSMDKKMAKKMLFTIVIVFSVIQTLRYDDIFGTASGYSALWLSLMYLSGAIIRQKRLLENWTSSKLFLMYIICTVITFLSKFGIELFTIHFWGRKVVGDFLINYTSPMMILAAIALVGFFFKLELHSFTQKIISILAPLSFSVYLIHTHPLVLEYVITGRFGEFAKMGTFQMLIMIFTTVVGIFAVCVIVDFGRMYLFKALKIRDICIQIESLMTKIFGKLL